MNHMKKVLAPLANWVIEYSPAPIQRYFRKRSEKRRIQKIKERFQRIKISKEEISSLVNLLSLNCDVFLHSSTTNIGKIDGGTKFLSELILNKVDITKHTLLAIASPCIESKDFQYIKSSLDIRTAAVTQGMINEYLALKPEACRSCNPTHSVIAIGPDANWYTGEHYKDMTPFSIHSPFYKLIERNAKILLFGVPLQNTTFCHVIEDLFFPDFPRNPYRNKLFRVHAVDQNGIAHEMVVRASRRLPHNCKIEWILPYLNRYDVIESYPVGESALYVLNVKRLVRAYCQALLDGWSVYGKFKPTSRLLERVNAYMEKLNG